MTDVSQRPLTESPTPPVTPTAGLAESGSDQGIYPSQTQRIDDDSTPMDRQKPPTPASRSLSVFAGLVVGAAAGLLLGVAMRSFMRLISEDPEFSWSGTVFIVMVFVIFGATQGLAAGARRAGLRRRWLTPLRLLGGFGMLLTMMAAGAVMAPTTLGAGLARHRGDWPRWARVLGAAVAALNVTVTSVTSLNGQAGRPAAWLGVLVMIACYSVVVLAAGGTLAPQKDGWHLPRWARIALVAGLVVPALLLAVSIVGVAR